MELASLTVKCFLSVKIQEIKATVE